MASGDVNLDAVFDVTSAHGTGAQYGCTLRTAHHVAAWEKYNITWGIHTDLAQSLVQDVFILVRERSIHEASKTGNPLPCKSSH